MLGFLQGFAYGLWVSCMPWLILGMVRPHWALPTDPPRRWQLFLRYGLIAPSIAMVSWLTSLWGGLEPSLAGWLCGLAAIPLSVWVERGLRRHRKQSLVRLEQQARQAEQARRLAEQNKAKQESGLLVLDPERLPPGADELVRALCELKRGLLQVSDPVSAAQVDRLYSRYVRVNDLIRARFDVRELAYQRALGLVQEVSHAATGRLEELLRERTSTAGMDLDYVRHRLFASGEALSAGERKALERRLELVEEGERRARELVAANEAALTALDDTAVAVSRIDTRRQHTGAAADDALQELQRFAANAERYSRTR